MAAIAWIGLGTMGSRMTQNLLAAGHTVRGFDLSEDACAAAAAQGVEIAGSVAEAVAGADVVFSMLPAGEHVRSVYLGAGGVLAAADPSTVLIDSSTIDVDTAKALHLAAREAGFTFIDGPVSGGASGAAAGTLTFMLGGHAEAVEQVRDVIEPMAGNIFHAGGEGAGQAAKIVNNMMLMINLQGAAEGAVLARKLGLDAQTFWDIARVSSADSWAMRTWYPVPDVVPTAASNAGFDATFATSLAHKDVGLALAGAQSVGVDLPAANVAFAGLQRLMDEGRADKDCSLLIRNIDPEAPGVPD